MNISWGNTAITGLRLVFGVDYLAQGLRWFVPGFWPMPKPEPGPGTAVVGALIGADFHGVNLFDLVKVLEIVCGLSWILGLWVPLTLVAAMPITLVIFIVDVLLIGSLSGHFWGWSSLLLNTILLLAYMKYLRPMLTMRAKPGF